MAVINYAKAMSPVVNERFAHDNITDSMFAHDYEQEFSDHKTVTIYEVGLAEVNDYQRSGTNRYGTPNDLDDYILELTMTQDKSSTWTIDKGNQKDQLNIKAAGNTLKRQLKEVYSPMIDKYRLAEWLKGAGTTVTAANAPTTSTLVGLMLDMNSLLDDKGVPAEGRTYVIPSTYYKALLLSSEFTHSDSLTTKSLTSGTIGELFGVPVKKVPSGYLPSGVYFAEIYKRAVISPVKLKDFKINTSPQGISGDLVEMRLYYDAFVIGARRDGIAVCAAAASIAAKPTASWSSYVATLSSSTASAVIYYTDDGSDPRYSKSRKTYNGSAKPTYTSADAGKVIKVVATKDGLFDSEVLETKVAAS